ncbi:MAG TPA: ribosomal-processing cysteine protease Prp [Syntrophomonadaceae bacterium]|nr:ribosomal-processing cysteine protease Prp [Syntrophomonadaceae bacterium]
MLKVTIDYQNQDIKGFMVKGHANYAPEGQDICCAGVSAITQTALMGLINHLEKKPVFKVEKGDLEVSLAEDISVEDNNKAQIILNTMLAGIESLQENYRSYIKVEFRRCKNV